MSSTSTLCLGLSEEEKEGVGWQFQFKLQINHVKVKNESLVVPSQLTRMHADHIQILYLEKGKKGANSQSINNVSIEYYKSTYIIIVRSLVILNKLELDALYFLTHSISLL